MTWSDLDNTSVTASGYPQTYYNDVLPFGGNIEPSVEINVENPLSRNMETANYVAQQLLKGLEDSVR